MLRYVNLLNWKYAVVYWLRILQYVIVLDRNYAVVYCLKMLQYVILRRCLLALNVTHVIVLDRSYAIVYWLTCHVMLRIPLRRFSLALNVVVCNCTASKFACFNTFI